MIRTNSTRFFRDKWRFSKSDPNQLHLPLDEALDVLLSGNDDKKRATLAQVRHNLERFPGAYDTVTLEKLRKLMATNRNGKIEVEYKVDSSVVRAARIVRIYRRIWRAGFSVAPKFAEDNDPPNRAEMLLHFGLPKRDRECMIGDLEEEYRTIILPKYGPGVAARWYWWQAVRSVIAASGGRVRAWLSFGGLARAAGWIVEKFTL